MTTQPFQLLSDKYLEGFRSQYLPQILDMLLTEDEAVLLERLPASAEEVAQVTGQDPASVSDTLSRLCETGLVLREEGDGEPKYGLDKDILDSLLQDRRIRSRLSDPEDLDRFLGLFRDLFENELKHDEKWSKVIIPQARVIPIERTITIKWGEVIPQERLSTVLEEARVIARAECTCRIIEKNCDHPTDVCILLNDFAENFIERGAAMRITKEVATGILKRTEDLGLVHQLNNTDSEGYEFICSCCSCCCMVLRAMTTLGKEDICYQSRYLARVNHDACAACGACVERCQFAAVRLDSDHAEVDDTRCFGCGLCASGCPSEAIEMVCIREPGHVTERLQMTI
ncbi:MAG: 4Fe-4S binding protein [Methanobacteriota archaeon]|nr:MAG: 4Fe-4S binding protein [Euryarchaeota archaeon]